MPRTFVKEAYKCTKSLLLLVSFHVYCTCLLENDHVTSRGLAWVKIMPLATAFLESQRFYTGMCDICHPLTFASYYTSDNSFVVENTDQQKEESEIHPECLQTERITLTFCSVSFQAVF